MELTPFPHHGPLDPSGAPGESGPGRRPGATRLATSGHRRARAATLRQDHRIAVGRSASRGHGDADLARPVRTDVVGGLRDAPRSGDLGRHGVERPRSSGEVAARLHLQLGVMGGRVPQTREAAARCHVDRARPTRPAGRGVIDPAGRVDRRRVLRNRRRGRCSGDDANSASTSLPADRAAVRRVRTLDHADALHRPSRAVLRPGRSGGGPTVVDRVGRRCGPPWIRRHRTRGRRHRRARLVVHARPPASDHGTGGRRLAAGRTRGGGVGRSGRSGHRRRARRRIVGYGATVLVDVDGGNSWCCVPPRTATASSDRWRSRSVSRTGVPSTHVPR